MALNIYQELKKLSEKKRYYFLWKNDLEWNREDPKKTTEEFLHTIGLRTLNTFYQWEESQEYQRLLLILTQSRFGKDLQETYETVAENAKTQGDEKNIKLMISLQKEIKQLTKQKQDVELGNDLIV